MVVLVIMGVCGCGKTTIAEELASKLQCAFRDADEFHSEENKQKMSSGTSLTDEDRIPWLLAIHKYIKLLLDKKATGVVTCSALKRRYRQILVYGELTEQSHQQHSFKEDILFVYLKGSKELINHRLKDRIGHFMPASLLQSQLETLEEPDVSENHLTLDIDKSVGEIVSEVIKCISL